MPIVLIEGRTIADLQTAIDAYLTAQSVADADITNCSISELSHSLVACLSHV